MFKPGSSVWNLSAMLFAIIAAAMLLVWLLTSWALTRTFDEIGRAVVLDDLGEYAVLYERGGVDGVRALFTAGQHDHDQILRIVGAAGEVKLDVLLPSAPELRWPDLSKLPAPDAGETVWHRHAAAGGATLTIGRRKLTDSAELWFGRTDAADRKAIDGVHRMITMAIVVTAVLAIGPVLWFANRVMRPVRGLITGAQRLVNSGTTIQRLKSSAAIPELEEFAKAFNESLDRVQALTEELEAANDQLAHELRTPLARIRGNIESILSHAEVPATRENAARAIGEIERTTNLVQTILSIRAGDARTMKLQPESVALGDLVSETCELYSAAAEQKGLTLTSRLASDGEPVPADRQRLHQALCNLLDNALAYTPRGGSVEVELTFDDSHAMIRVRDTGPGLSGTDAERIWRRFMRGSAASAGTPGIGLGLSLVKAIAHVHRGDAGADNRPGGGAEFWIRIPRITKVLEGSGSRNAHVG